MAKNSKNIKKNKKASVPKEKVEKEEEKNIAPSEEETEKETGTLSDGVLDAFDELAPVDPLLEDETILPEDDEDDEIDSGDFKPSEEW